MWITMIKEAGPLGLPLLTLLPIGLLAAVGVGMALVMNQRVASGWMAALLSLPLGLAALAGALGLIQASEAVAHASAETKMTLLAAGTATSLFMHALPRFVVLLPALVLGAFCAFTGASKGDKRPGFAAAVGGLSILTALSAGMAAFATADYFGGLVILTLCLLVGILAAVSSLGGDHDTSAPVASATATALLPLVVGAELMSHAATSQIMVFEAVAHASAETKADLMGQGIAIAQAGSTWAWVALVLAAITALVGVYGALDERAPMRNAAVVAGLLATFAAFVGYGLDPWLSLEIMRGMF